MIELISGGELNDFLIQYGSPVNILSSQPMPGHIDEIQSAAAACSIRLGVYFACKTNKSPAFVDAAVRARIGVDVASESEIETVLQRGVSPKNIVCTASIKSQALLDRCLSNSITIVVDNHDEVDAVAACAANSHTMSKIAIRLGGFAHQGTRLPTRFGFDACGSMDWLERISQLPLEIRGVHFHLDGCQSDQRVSGLRQSLIWIERLRCLGHAADFIDIGGGFPVSYLDDSPTPRASSSAAKQWAYFWQMHSEALQGKRSPITYRNHGLGRVWAGGQMHGQANVYPTYQPLSRGEWLANILNADIVHGSDQTTTIAEALLQRGLELRCQPGRSLVDDCGMTVARVEFRKRSHDADEWFIGLSMNRTQYRTTHDEFLVDPILVPTNEITPTKDNSGEIAGYLVGAYCTEYELLSLRKLRFPYGVRVGDLIVFPNTAGYLMHFMESRCHQIPLAENVVCG